MVLHEKRKSKDIKDYNNVKIESTTDKLWRPKEIQERIEGITTRQLTDLAEREIIKAAHETTGAGTSRLYDHTGLYSIMIAMALRGSVKRSSLNKMINTIIQTEKSNDHFKPEVLIINLFNGENAKVEDGGLQMTFFYQKNDGEIWNKLGLLVGGANPKSYVTHVVFLHDIKRTLKRLFS